MRPLPSLPLDALATLQRRTPESNLAVEEVSPPDGRPAQQRSPPCLSSVCRTRHHTASCAECVQEGHMRCPLAAFPETGFQVTERSLDLARPSYSRTSSIALAAA